MVADEYDFWLFDLDGTLVDVEPSYVEEVFEAVGRRIGRQFSDREVRKLWYGLGDTRNDLLRARGIDPDAFWPAFDAVADPASRAEATYLYEDAAVVGGLDRPIGLVTHCPRATTDAVLAALDVGDWFEAVVCCTPEVGMKPDPTPVRAAVRDLGMAANGHAGVLAGDSAHDVGAAWNAGLDAVHVERHDPRQRGHCVRADYRVERFDELVAPDEGTATPTGEDSGTGTAGQSRG